MPIALPAYWELDRLLWLIFSPGSALGQTGLISPIQNFHSRNKYKKLFGSGGGDGRVILRQKLLREDSNVHTKSSLRQLVVQHCTKVTPPLPPPHQPSEDVLGGQ